MGYDTTSIFWRWVCAHLQRQYASAAGHGDGQVLQRALPQRHVLAEGSESVTDECFDCLNSLH